MPCKTKPGQSSRQCLRMVHALPPDTPRPPQFQPEAPGFREIQKPILMYFVMKLPSNLPSNVEKWTFRCHVRPNPAKVRDNVFVWSAPSPWTPPDLPNFNLNCEKTSFCEKLDSQFFCSFCIFLGPIGLLKVLWVSWAGSWEGGPHCPVPTCTRVGPIHKYV